ncbi:AAA family ATPase [Leucothrix pacifica]|uniref:ATP-binding protein n=1 Tax=Leucothrix pacifica TaxID=1247513 RepID=A0A317CEQ9_9GAMM|nr:AAA family ATPase [Leucothrix pacifica]PWQ96581.1 ATP-binding protein [Leucothrix pacifica]
MKIERLYLSNFRRFRELEISFDSKLTVLVARNGQGKTTILDAATAALGPFTGAFDLGKSKHIEVRDARYLRKEDRSDSEQQFPVVIKADFDLLDEPVIRELNSVKSKTTTKGSAHLNKLGKDLMEQVRQLQDINLPMLAYYGSGRLWNSHKNMQRKAVLSESRSMGYEDCFSSASSFTQVQQWMSKATFAALQQQSMEAYEGYPLQDQIDGIKQTVNRVLQNQEWSGFHYSMQHEELAMTHADLGVLPVSLLSDGVRAMVSLVADMAWRCAKLNPYLGKDAQTKAKGIVFIDEVDMHLHPQWQQTVIGSLRESFPNIQFIVTTHSPQVLSTVPAECIRVLKNQTDSETGELESTAKAPGHQSLGVASADVMATIQGVDPIPDVEPAHWLTEFKSLITNSQLETERAQELKDKIMDHFGEHHQEWLECQRLIRLQVMKAKLPKRNG